MRTNYSKVISCKLEHVAQEIVFKPSSTHSVMGENLNVGVFTGSNISTFGGGERYAIELSNELFKRGFNVTIFTQSSGRVSNMALEEILKICDVNIKKYASIYTRVTPTIPFFNFRQFQDLNCIYNMDESIFTNVLLQLYSKLKKKKYLYGMHIPRSFLFGNESAENRIKKVLWKFYRIPLIAFFKAFVEMIHVINCEQKLALETMGFRNTIHLIPDFVTKVPQEVENNEYEFIVIFTGALNIEIKGIDLLAEIIKKSLEKNSRMKFVVSGNSGNGYNYIYDLTKRYAGTVSYLGFVSEDELEALQKKASLFVFTSRIDSFSLGIVGAQCYGLPCVAFNISGPRDILTESFQGKVVSKFETDVFVQEILNYYDLWNSDKKEYLKIKEKIQNNIYSKIGKDVIIPKIIKMFST